MSGGYATTNRLVNDALYNMLINQKRKSYDEIVAEVRSGHPNFSFRVSAHMTIKDYLDEKLENQTLGLDEDGKYFHPKS